MNSNIFKSRLNTLRQIMQQHNIDAFIALSNDPHMSEYLPDYWKIRQWLTGFTGSVGTIVITKKFAGLWVDGRYWVQAEQELQGTGFELQKQTPLDSSTHWYWLNQNLKDHACISINNQTFSVQQFEQLETIIQRKHLTLKTDFDLITAIWHDRPALSTQPIHKMREGINTYSCREKIQKIREQLKQLGAESHFISSVDDIAWILNCRGADVEYNPVFLSHLYIDEEKTHLFIDFKKLNQTLHAYFQATNIQLHDYHESASFLKQLSTRSILIDPTKVSLHHKQTIPQSTRIIYNINPSTLLKSIKTSEEIEHIRQVMIKDGVALCHFFHWLDQALQNQEIINELTIDEKITAYRAQQAGFIGLSFSTIAGFNENGALPHYRATLEKHSQIQGNGLLLIDSGAQYESGTTDITRVVPIGQISAEHKRDYTLVLKCHIALAQAVFPEGLSAPLLDAIARQPLWQQQLDYRHGTGHGVGFALNVHEGSQVLSYYAPIHTHSKLHAGMITSNEPGLYHAGRYGIRIENLVATRLLENNMTDYGAFLKFETLTLCPIHLDCIEKSLLTKSETDWLNNYHQMVYTRLAPQLSGEVLSWLEVQTRPL